MPCSKCGEALYEMALAEHYISCHWNAPRAVRNSAHLYPHPSIFRLWQLSAGFRAFSVSVCNVQEYFQAHLKMIEKSALSQTILTLFSNPCRPNGFQIYCRFACHGLEPKSPASFPSRSSPHWYGNSQWHRLNGELADQLKIFSLNSLFGSACFSRQYTWPCGEYASRLT
jgi:hypothetical protein